MFQASNSQKMVYMTKRISRPKNQFYANLELKGPKWPTNKTTDNMQQAVYESEINAAIMFILSHT